MNADSIKIECEEDGFWLVIKHDEHSITSVPGTSRVNIHSCAEALHEQVNLIIGGWLAEGEQAKRRVRESANRDREQRAIRSVFACDPDESGGRLTDGGYENPQAYDRPGSAYSLEDPKHPDYHSVHADIYDNREKV